MRLKPKLPNAVNSQDPEKIAITKLDAVRRQLETSVILWFHDGDPVSIHTLVSAAYQIVYDIHQKRGGVPMKRDLHIVQPGYVKEFRRQLAQYENFFKHADKDPLQTVFFPPEITRFFLVDTIEKYHELANEQRPLLRLFIYYMVFIEPQMFEANFAKRFHDEIATVVASGVSRREFFHQFLPVLTKIESAACQPIETD